MKQIGKEEVVNLLNEKRYIVNEVIMRRISWYSYKEITILSVEKDRIIIRTEMPIKGIYDTVIPQFHSSNPKTVARKICTTPPKLTPLSSRRKSLIK